MLLFFSAERIYSNIHEHKKALQAVCAFGLYAPVLTVWTCTCVFAELGTVREGHTRVSGEAEGVQEEAGAAAAGPP